MKKFLPVLFIALVVVVFFWKFFVNGLLPIPSDTIVGLYHPFRDLYAKDYPNGIPFKNFLITDPVRQQYPWRELAFSMVEKSEIPLWNPYSLSGTPLLANFQSSPFYFFNILFFITSFVNAWSLIIFLGPLLSGFFLFLYLDDLKLSRWASILGAITFSFSGFFVAWMEWGTITHVALWLPLILLSIDKIVSGIKYQVLSIKSRKFLVWSLVYLISLVSSFFAGHLQTFFYLFIFSIIYFLARWIQFKLQKRTLFLFIVLNSLFIILSSIQWFPALQFILLSARNVDQAQFDNPGWFIPWQHLLQFIAPDYFGNPVTLNYWGTWNYAELVGYIGILPLIMAILALFFRRDKKTFFYGAIFFVSLIFSLPTIFAKVPYILNIPFLSTSQPTRLLFMTDFSLAVLAAFGFDYFIKSKKKEIVYPLIFIAIIFSLLWMFVLFGNNVMKLVVSVNLSVAKNNLILPTSIFIFSVAIITIYIFLSKSKLFTMMIHIIIVGITIFDLFRFGWKFIPFTKQDYLFPNTKVISYLKSNLGNYRYMTTDSRILPPNFSSIYRIQSVDGYDPLYLLRYAELIAASERNTGNINPPFGFNRIITPQNYDSKIIDLLGVKYILNLSELSNEKLKKVFQEGETRVYLNTSVLPRAFFIEKIMGINSKEDAIKAIFNASFRPETTAVVENGDKTLKGIKKLVAGNVDIINYSENKVVIRTENSGIGFLIFTDTFYPAWKASVDGKAVKIYKADYNFRGIIVSEGKHKIEFYTTLF